MSREDTGTEQRQASFFSRRLGLPRPTRKWLLALPLGVLLVMFSGLVGDNTKTEAQATRTWVSGVGDDANPCSRTAPCKTFAGAISKTAASGEINCLDAGGFGAVTITKAMTIRCSVEAGVLVSGTNGIIVAAGANDRVVLEGLDIEGIGSGTNGVLVNSGKEVYIIKCSIQHFTQNGVNMASSTSLANLFIQNSKILFNNGGVSIAGAANQGSIESTEIDSNIAFSLQARGGSVGVAVSNSGLRNSPVALDLSGGAQAFSFGPSNVVTGTGAFSLTLPFK